MQMLVALLGAGLALSPIASSAQAVDGARGDRDPLTLRVRVSGGEVRIQFGATSGILEVVSPAGTFQVSPLSASEFTEWAAVSEQLEASFISGRDSVASEAEIVSFLMERNVMWLTPVARDSTTRFVLQGENGAWNFRLPLSHAESATLLRALRRQRGGGVEVVTAVSSDPLALPGPSDPSGAWLVYEVDRPARAARGALRIANRGGSRGARSEGPIQLGFVVESDGSVRASSVQLLKRGPTPLVLAARDALLRAKFEPAQRAGVAVPMRMSHVFEF